MSKEEQSSGREKNQETTYIWERGGEWGVGWGRLPGRQAGYQESAAIMTE